MIDLSQDAGHIKYVTDFKDLVSTPFLGEVNAICWARTLTGDFSEIVKKLSLSGNVTVIEPEDLDELPLSEKGQLAREILLNDLRLLKAHGASPVLNVIKCYDRDDSHPFFPTDVYSFHVDASPVSTDTFLCTYCGDCSEILPNSQATRKVLIPEIRNELSKGYSGTEEGFESFLSEHFFDLHYQAKPNARPIRMGPGQVWRLAIAHPESQVLPCIHRAPKEESGQNRLLLIC